MATTSLAERQKALGARIAAARARLGARDDFEHDDIGDLLEAINDDLEEITHHDEAAAHARYDALEARLAAAQSRLDAAGRPQR